MSLLSVVFRLSKKRKEQLHALSRETRVRPSEYLREAIDDVLKKHEAKLAEIERQAP